MCWMLWILDVLSAFDVCFATDDEYFLSWFLRKPGRTLEEVPMPPLRGDELHRMTVLPYLIDYFYGDDDSQYSSQYFTERELNGL